MNDVFIPETYDGTFSYNGVTLVTLNDVFSIENQPMWNCNDFQYICVFENDDAAIRVTANIPAKVKEKIDLLDFMDEDYDAQLKELVGELKIIRLDDLSAEAPSQEGLNGLVGMTGKDLNENGYLMNQYLDDDSGNSVAYANGCYKFNVTFEEPLPDSVYDNESSVDAYTVKSVEYAGLSYDVFNIYDE